MIAWLATGRVEIAGAIALSDLFLKTAAFYVFERVWLRIDFGKTRPRGPQTRPLDGGV